MIIGIYTIKCYEKETNSTFREKYRDPGTILENYGLSLTKPLIEIRKKLKRWFNLINDALAMDKQIIADFFLPKLGPKQPKMSPQNF